jgi:hypothetical protein
VLQHQRSGCHALASPQAVAQAGAQIADRETEGQACLWFVTVPYLNISVSTRASHSQSRRGNEMKINITRTAVVRSRWAALATVTLFATACSTGSNTSGVTATSSTGGTTTSTSDETTTTTSTPDETTTSTSVETTTSASETTLPGELSGITPIVAGDGSTLYYYDHLSNSPPVTIGPLTEPDHYLLSPDGRYAAVEHSGDAIRKARLEIVATDTGTPVLSIDFDADGVTASAWSPDSTAVLAAPRSTTNPSSAAVYRIDGTSQPLAGDAVCADSRQELLWVQGGSGVTVLQNEECGITGPAKTDAVQLMTSKGEPVAVYSYLDLSAVHLDPQGQLQYAGSTGRFDVASGGKLIPFEGLFGNNFDRLVGCGRFAILATSESTSGGQVTYGLYDSDSGTITPIDLKPETRYCPIASNQGTLVAYEATDGVRVLDLATGNQTQIAREGYPVAWSKDNSKVLVQGNGTFVVAADGSGGKPASIALQEFCVAGNTGTVITVVGELSSFSPVDLLEYDIATDIAKPIGKGQLDSDVCEASSDGNWVVAGHTVIDLAEGHSAIVTAPLMSPLDAHLHLRGAAFVGSISQIQV